MSLQTNVRASTQKMSYENLKQKLANLYQDYYVRGFKENDITIIDQIVEYPMVYIKDGKVAMVDEYPVNPGELKSAIGWDHSINWKMDVSAINENEAHLTASATRCRADGSEIEDVAAVYFFKRVGEEWKMFGLADIVS